jgi:hypothetical protein
MSEIGSGVRCKIRSVVVSVMLSVRFHGSDVQCGTANARRRCRMHARSVQFGMWQPSLPSLPSRRSRRRRTGAWRTRPLARRPSLRPGTSSRPWSNGVIRPPSALVVPILTLPDGRVFADFGYGFEQIVSSCASVRRRAAVGWLAAATQLSRWSPSPRPRRPRPPSKCSTPPANSASVTNTLAATSCWLTEAGFVQVFRR